MNPSRRLGSTSASVRSSTPAVSNSGVKPRRLSAGVTIRGASATLTGRPRPVAGPLDPGVLAHGRVQVDEPGIDDQPFAFDRLGVIRDHDVLVRPDRRDHPPADDDRPRLEDLPGAAITFAPLIAYAAG